MHPRHIYLSLALVLLTSVGAAEHLPGGPLLQVTLAADKEKSAGDEAVELKPSAESVEPEPYSGVTSDLVYSVLVAQIADQRGDQRMAFTHYLHAARMALDSDLAERAARAALILKDTDAIQSSIDTWLEIAPESMGAHQIATYVSLEADDVAGALIHLRRIIVLAAEQGSDGFLQAARLVNKLRPPERRLALMETLTADEPENADAWFARALVAAGADSFDQAQDAARVAAELRSGWNEPRIFLVQVLLLGGKQEEARSTLEAFLKEGPNNHELNMLYAQLLVDEKEFVHARDVFELMLSGKPEEPDVLFALGILSLQLEDVDAAREYFTRLRATGQRQSDSAYYLGQAEELADNLDTAVSWYRKVEGEHALDAQIRVARVRAEQGAPERAREILQQLRDQWPDEAVTLYLIEAEILRDLDLHREAMGVYDAALAAHPDTPDLLYSRALLGAALNRVDILERDLKAILDVEPEHADALNALGYTLADQTDRYEEARGYVARAMALKPDDPAVLDSMGWVQYRLGNLEESLEHLRKALELMPDGEIAAHLGEVLWAMGRRDEAWNVWEKALATDPDHAYLLRVIGRHRVTSSTLNQ